MVAKTAVIPKDKLKCAGCGSGQTYIRQSTSERVCRVCGTVSPVKK